MNIGFELWQFEVWTPKLLRCFESALFIKYLTDPVKRSSRLVPRWTNYAHWTRLDPLHSFKKLLLIILNATDSHRSYLITYSYPSDAEVLDNLEYRLSCPSGLSQRMTNPEYCTAMEMKLPFRRFCCPAPHSPASTLQNLLKSYESWMTLVPERVMSSPGPEETI